jgi:hypothetical protein
LRFLATGSALVGVIWLVALRLSGEHLGRDWADTVLEDISRSVSAVVTDVLVAQSAATDEARHALWTAVRDVERA